MNDVLAIGFDYSTLDPEIAAEARAIAERVRARHRQHVEAIIATGCELLRVKAALAHGHFGEWLAAEFGWTGRTARNYMAAAEHFRTRTETVSVLPPAVIYQLTARSTPQHLRDDIINR